MTRIRPRQESVLRTGPLPETADADHVTEGVDAVAFAAAPPECPEIFDRPPGAGAPPDRVTGPRWIGAQSCHVAAVVHGKGVGRVAAEAWQP